MSFIEKVSRSQSHGALSCHVPLVSLCLNRPSVFQDLDTFKINSPGLLQNESWVSLMFPHDYFEVWEVIVSYNSCLSITGDVHLGNYQ